MKLKSRRRMLVVAFLLCVSMIATPVKASTNLQPGDAPASTGDFTPQVEGDTYKEPENTFTDGDPKYYLITQDPTKDVPNAKVTYKGQEYPVEQVLVGSDLDQLKIDGDARSIFDYRSPGNRTFFVDDGTYIDNVYTNYTGLSKENLSVVGLNKNGTEPTAIFTKAAYPMDYSAEAARDLMERYNIMHPNIYFENMIFDGGNKDLLPLGGKGGIGKNRGEYMFYLTTNTQGFVMKDVILQNVGADSTTQPGGIFSSHLIRKNVAINFYRTTGQKNFDNLIIRNVKTKEGFGIVSFNQTRDNYFKDLTIVGDNANPRSRSIKVETMSNNTSVIPLDQNNAHFDGNISLPSDAAHNHIYVQDYRYEYVKVPADFQYAKWRTRNGSNYAESFDIYKDYPGSSDGWAVHDLRDGYWIVDADSEIAIEKQLADIKSVRNYAGDRAPLPNIKLVATGDIPGFTVPDFGAVPVNIVAVNSMDKMYTSKDLVPFAANGTINLPEDNQVKLYNFDFDSKAAYTMQEAVNGITPLTAE